MFVRLENKQSFHSEVDKNEGGVGEPPVNLFQIVSRVFFISLLAEQL